MGLHGQLVLILVEASSHNMCIKTRPLLEIISNKIHSYIHLLCKLFIGFIIDKQCNLANKPNQFKYTYITYIHYNYRIQTTTYRYTKGNIERNVRKNIIS